MSDAAEFKRLFTDGKKAVTLKKYDTAIATLQEALTLGDAGQASYFQAQRQLVKAYQATDRFGEASALCQEMLQSDREMTRIWAHNFLEKLPAGSAPPLPTTPAQEPQAPVTEPATDLPAETEIPPSPTATEASAPEPPAAPAMPAAAPAATPTIPSAPNPAPDIAPDTASDSPGADFTLPNLQAFKRYCQQNILTSLKAADRKRKTSTLTFAAGSVAFLGLLVLSLAAIYYSIKFAILFYTDPEFRDRWLPSSSGGFRRRRGGRFMLPLVAIGIASGLSGFVVWGWASFYSSTFESFARGLKDDVTRKLAAFIQESGEVERTGMPHFDVVAKTCDALQASRLFLPVSDRSALQERDLFQGRAGGTQFAFSEIQVLQNLKTGQAAGVSSSMDSRLMELALWPLIVPRLFQPIAAGAALDMQKLRQETFYGSGKLSRTRALFLRATLPNATEGEVIVTSNQKTALERARLLGWGSSTSGGNFSPTFKRTFKTYCNSPQQLDALLPDTLQTCLLNAQRRSKDGLYLSISADKLYFAILLPEPLFEPNMYASTASFKSLQDYHAKLQTLFGILAAFEPAISVASTSGKAIATNS